MEHRFPLDAPIHLRYAKTQILRRRKLCPSKNKEMERNFLVCCDVLYVKSALVDNSQLFPIIFFWKITASFNLPGITGIYDLDMLRS